MSNRLPGGVHVARLLAMAALVAVPRAGGAATTVQTSLAASVNVVSSCAVSKTTAMSFPTVTNAGSEDEVTADGSMTYECQGIAPSLTANDNADNAKFRLSRPTGYLIYFTICAVESGNSGVCTPIENGNKTKLALPDSGTQVFRGTIDRASVTRYQIGGYTDNIVLTLTF